MTASAWREVPATRAHVIVDAADYFALMREAMLNARHRIMLIGWDFDTRIDLGPGPGKRKGKGGKNAPPGRLGDFIVWLADRTPGLEVRILKWNFGALKMLARGSTLLDVARWAWHSQIQLKLDGAHPVGCSHHQKIVVVDDRIAVCGGIDMTSERWDTREHRDPDARRKRPNGSRYGPWHDVTMMVEGEAAAALAELSRARWEVAGGGAMPPCPAVDLSPWPEALEAEFRDVRVRIARTRAAHGDCEEIREVEALFVEQILRARHFIYIENQYFTSRRIAEAIVRRVKGRKPPEIVLVNPASAHGWLEQAAMDGARTRLFRAIEAEDRHKRFGIFVPHTTRGQPIYVHAKLLIVDDELIRVGSANMNNRSLGLDSECDLCIEAAGRGSRATAAAIRAIRYSLLAEHCGLTERQVAARLDKLGSMHGLIDGIPRAKRRLRRLELAELSDAEKLVADGEILDPEHATELFEPFSSAGLFSRSRILRKPR